MPSLRRVLAAAVLGAMVAAGCSSGGGESAGPTTSTGSAATEAAPERGGILRLAIERPAHLDPARARSVPQSELVVADLLYDGLTAYDADAGAAVPALASGWEADAGMTTWRFAVDPASRFSDGAPVRADDVKASLERVVMGGPEAPAARLLRTIEGWDEMAAGAAASLAGVSVEGEDVVVRLSEPMSALAEVFASPLLGIARQGATAASLDALPAGTGPFRLAAGEGGILLDGEVIGLERSAGGAALVDGVDLVLFDDGAAALAAVAAGAADAAFVPADGGRNAASAQVSTPFGASLFYGFNLRSPKLSDVRFREAIVAAVDRQAIVDDVYRGALDPLAGVVPAGVPGASADGCGRRCDHDPGRARVLVAEVFPAGDVPALFVDVDTGSRQEQVGAAIVADLRAVGIPASVRAHRADEYPAFLASGQHELVRLGWTGDWPSAGAYLRPLFRSGAAENVVGLTLAAVDDALDQAASAPDASQRNAAHAAAERLVMGAFPVLPIGQFRTGVAIGERVRGLEVSVTGTFDVTRVHLVGQP